jgi:hypothetical protein
VRDEVDREARGEPVGRPARDARPGVSVLAGSSARARSLLAHSILIAAVSAVLIPGLAQAALGQSGSAGLRLAYIDPGAGSFVVQALVATLAGVAVALRLYWRKVKTLFGVSVEAEDDDESSPDGA